MCASIILQLLYNGGIIIPRGKDLKPRKKRKTSSTIADAIKSIASKLKKKTEPGWSFNFGEKDDKPKPPESLPGRYVFKSIEINLRDLIK